MAIKFTGRHIEVTPALKSHVEDQFGKLSTLFEGKAPKVHVIIEVERGRHHSEMVVNWRNETLTANSSNGDMYKSLSDTITKIGKQARKLQDKVIDRSHKARKSAVIGARAESIRAEDAPRIILTKRYAVKPMAAEEAAMVLEAGKNPFLLFRDSDSGGISLIHKRADGNYGLIQT